FEASIFRDFLSEMVLSFSTTSSTVGLYERISANGIGWLFAKYLPIIRYSTAVIEIVSFTVTRSPQLIFEMKYAISVIFFWTITTFFRGGFRLSYPLYE